MKVLVTGAAGFIGGYVVAELLWAGHEVVGLDNFSKYGPVSHEHETHPRYTLYEGDARDVDNMTELMWDVDHVIAGAAMIGGISYFHEFAYDLLACNERIIASTCDAAVEARRAGRPLRKVTYLSSSMVFESAFIWPSAEGDQLRIPPPFSSYGFQKLAVEYFARAAWDQHGVPYTIVRPFNAVGVGEQRATAAPEIASGNITLAMSHVVPDLAQKIIRGQDPLHILGDGTQVRCYTYGGDVAAGIVRAMGSPAAHNEDFNISTDERTTVAELASAIWRKVHPDGRPLRLVHDKPYDVDVARRIPATDKAWQVLGFRATTTLDQSLNIVIPWVRDAIDEGKI